MTIQSPASIGIVFVALGVVFLGVDFRDYLKIEGKLTIARKTWLHMAFIFAGVGIGLYFVQTFFQ
jgi:hypothetical protein